MKLKNWLLLVASLYLSSALAADKNDLYITVGNLVLESNDHVVKPVQGLSQGKKDERKPAEKLKDALKLLDASHKSEIVFNLLAELGNLKQEVKIMEPYVLHELSILCGSEMSKRLNVFRHIEQGRVRTAAGSAVLARLLAEPITDVNILKNRQKMVKLLLSDDALFEKLDKALERIQNYEDQFYNFWNPQADVDPMLLKRVYFPEEAGIFPKSWNASSRALQNLRRFLIGIQGFNTIGVGAYMVTLNPITLGYATHVSGGTFIPGAICGAAVEAVFGFALYKSFQDFKLQNHICYTVQKKTQGAAKAAKSLHACYHDMHNEREIVSGMKSFDKLEEFVNKPYIIDEEFEELLELLDHDVFKGKPNWRSHLGTALAVYERMKTQKNGFIGAMEAAGELDAYLAIAKLVRSFKSERVKYCFVDYVKSDVPVIQLDQVWNPLIDKNEVVTETIGLGKPDFAQNIMLTGPHGGGKSTFMKSIAYAVILGQTFGIAPAQSARLTIFDRINSYVNIKENLAEGQSTFMAEKKRVDDILGVIQNASPTQKIFSIMDEVFKGTMEAEGSARLHRFGNQIGLVPNSLSIIATHFEKPARLEEETQGKWTNYHVGLIEQSDNTFKRTFRLVEGANQWWFNDPSKRERYIEWLTSIN